MVQEVVALWDRLLAGISEVWVSARGRATGFSSHPLSYGGWGFTALAGNRGCFQPPPFSDGNRICRYQGIRRRRPSMGPPPFGSGNLLTASVGGVVYVVLQWGHRLSAVETAICALTRISTRGIVRLPPQIPLGPVAGSSQLNTHFVVCCRSVARGVTGHLHHWTSRKTPACLPPIILSPPPCGAVRGRFPG